MEFGDDDDHEEEEQEDEGDQEDEDDDDDEDDEGITIPPPPSTQQPTQTQVEASPSNHNQEQLSFRKPGLTSSSSISTPASSTTTTYRYRECLKNHAVSMGGHAVDGCGEFMPAGEEGTLESFKCAACGCHRNFHRKESDISSTPPPPPPPPLYPHHQFSSSPFNYRTPLPPQPSPFQVVAPPPPSQTVHHHNYRPGRLALPSSGRIDHYQLHNREMDEFSNPSSSGGGGGGGTRRVTSGSGSGSGKSKRFRTKFTPEQKERMLEFAERVGWRLQKHDEIAVQQFCQDVGVRRQVLKVWMHNNKNTLGGSSSRRSTTV